MILVISPYQSERLAYTIDFINSCYPNLDIQLTKNRVQKNNSTAVIVNYSNEIIPQSIPVYNSGFLNTTSIESDIKWHPKTPNPVFLYLNDDLDIFGALFFHLSRYEEYQILPTDEHGRFSTKNSIFYKYNCLKEPYIDILLSVFINELKLAYPAINTDKTKASFLPTLDIDIAYAYLGRGFIRSAGAFAKNMLHPFNILERISVLLGLKTDPFYCFSDLKQFPLLYFVHTGKYGKYDKNTGLEKQEFQDFIRNLDTDKIGLHPSYSAHLDLEEMAEQKQALMHLSAHNIYKSRQHFIKLKIPYTYQLLEQIGITEDYSMGWTDHAGYRSGTVFSHFFFDLSLNKVSSLKLFPFCWMDAHYIYHKNKLDLETMQSSYRHFLAQCKKHGGIFTPIFHNNHFYKFPELFDLLHDGNEL